MYLRGRCNFFTESPRVGITAIHLASDPIGSGKLPSSVP